eukprot:TRINITY_DN414_c0_g2_i1.p1 TRINITY_DN414_c0_g2~~TRINITY_DN414_c0_g2_i1.p1  ORF type:complete len:167 (-),score=38.86 TRINITY_DN414_c0_g2_i1:33-533(-)
MQELEVFSRYDFCKTLGYLDTENLVFGCKIGVDNEKNKYLFVYCEKKTLNLQLESLKKLEKQKFEFDYEGNFQIDHIDKKTLLMSYPKREKNRKLCIKKSESDFVINDKFCLKEFPNQILSQKENFVNAILDLLPENNDAIELAAEFIGKETDIFSEEIDIDEFIF